MPRRIKIDISKPRTCSKCNCLKQPEEFYTTSTSTGICIICHRIKMREWQNKNRSVINRKAERWRFKHRYGISLEEYKEMYKQQGGVCAICLLPGDFEKRELFVDHCHSTGKVRGLLCRACNHGIGIFKDNINSLIQAVEYLKNN